MKSTDKKDFVTLFVEVAEPREEILDFPVMLWRFPVVVKRRVTERNGRDGEKTRGDVGRRLFGYEDDYPSSTRISRTMSKQSFANSEINFSLNKMIASNKFF